MASAKKKQDEKNLQILRELVSLAGNKECFDCQQRGPTYINMTIGSFVCTTCSGLLRGLTPPHRVKSISMATFTQEEIDFLTERGNEFCKAIWLGLIPSNFSNCNKNEQKIKDLMSAKYEEKQYYLDPVMANEFFWQRCSKSLTIQNDIKNSNTPGSHQTETFFPQFSKTSKKNESKLLILPPTNFIADFSKTPLPNPAVISSQSSQQVIQSSFANFDNNPIYDSTTENQSFGSYAVQSVKSLNSPQPEDRYAALKDLDSEMKQGTAMKDSTLTEILKLKDSTNDEKSSSSIIHSDESLNMYNPFFGKTWQALNKTENNDENKNLYSIRSDICKSFNPFIETEESICNSDHIMFENDTQNLENVSSSCLPHETNKLVQAPVTSLKNPFVVDSNVEAFKRKSKNPFL